MHFLISLLFLLSLPVWSQVLPDQQIYTQGSPQFFQLGGEPGLDGSDGADAYEIDCAEHPWRVIDGIDGEDGLSGEDGQDGQDVIIRYQNRSELSLIQLNNPGGLGGAAGKGGAGTNGCNGGSNGEVGRPGQPGRDGEFGKVFLVPRRVSLPRVNATQIITLEELLNNRTTLSHIKWQSNSGLKNLLDPNSNTSDEYFTFAGTIKREVRVNWNAGQPLSEFLQTRIGLHLADDGLHINNYRGPFLRYRIQESEDRSTIIIDNVIREDSLANLKLGKMRNSMFDLTLEVKRKYDLLIPFRTFFNLSIFEVDSDTNDLSLVGHFRVPDELVQFDEDRFQIYIGKLNYPLQYKRRGVKLRVFLSVTRENDNQRRTYVLKGLYRI